LTDCPFSNVPRCIKCNKVLIAEEFDTHACERRKKVKDYKIEGNILWLYDGINWYPRKLSITNRKSTTENNNGGFNRTNLLVSGSDFHLFIILMYRTVSGGKKTTVAIPTSLAERLHKMSDGRLLHIVISRLTDEYEKAYGDVCIDDISWHNASYRR
jgi:hypothetical protein